MVRVQGLKSCYNTRLLFALNPIYASSEVSWACSMSIRANLIAESKIRPKVGCKEVTLISSHSQLEQAVWSKQWQWASTLPISMATPLSISSTPFARPPFVLLCPSSPFKGNVRSLRSNPFPSRLKAAVRVEKVEAVRNQVVATSYDGARLRLDNLGPQPGSRKKAKRKGRGISAGQGGSCGFGMRGQKSRSGPGVRKGFEGGQMPLYRRLPKLRGIAGGMHAGLPKYVPVNLKDIEAAGFQEGDEVSLETLKKKGLINPSGRERKLPLKILGDGELSAKLNIKARAVSAAAKEKLESSGCSISLLPGRKKWVKPSVVKNLARAEEYFAKKKAAASAAQ